MTAVDDLVVATPRAYMATYVCSALASDAMLIARMRERGVRVFVFDHDPAHEDGDVDAELTAAIEAIDLAGTDLPVFVAQLHLYRLRGRYGSNARPFAVQPPRGVFLGAIALGEGGAIFLGADGQLMPSTTALEQLRTLIR